ncbi:flagellar hook protein FlgE [Candidatus Omnitrophota bacterium]
MTTRAMISGVSGMRANGIKMDVIGNNIANLNTVGYKSHKALFADLLSQTVSGGTAAVTGGTGGMNPVQVGLGVQVASIQSNFQQGSLMATGKITDLAISGEGFFVLDNESAILYSRDGAFGLDTDSTLVNPANGYKVQGWTADSDGMVSTLGAVGDITIPFGSSTVAAATSEVDLVGNLDSSGDDGESSIAVSGVMYEDNTQTVRASATSALTGLYDASGNALNLENGDTLTVGATKGAGTITTRTFTVGTTGTTLDDFREFMEHTFGITGDSSTSASEGVRISGSASGETDGQLAVIGNIGDANAITEITISGTDAGGGSVLNTTAFQQIFGPDVGNNGFTELNEADGESSFTQTTLYDSLGQAHTVDLIFSRVSANTYSFFANSDDNFLAGSRGSSVRASAGVLSFTSAGAYTSFTGNSVELNLTNGATTPLNVDIDGQELTGFGSTSSVNVSAQDGFPPGNLNSYTIGETGLITGIYSNGLTRDIAQIAMATFPNEEGLLLQGDNLYAPGVNSGPVSVGAALLDGRGSINSGYLENSNVDLAEEFSQMIMTQRAYQANARTINVADALLAESVNLV